MKIEHLSVLATDVVAFTASTALLMNGRSELHRDMLAGQAEIGKDMRAGRVELREDVRAVETGLRRATKAGDAELRQEIRAVEAELRAGQTGIRKDLQSLEVRLAVVERRTARLSGEPGASAADPAPASSLDGRHQSARASLLPARVVATPFGSLAAGASSS